MADHDLTNTDIQAFLDKLGSGAPTPGGGTASALSGAMGASLVHMLAKLTIARPQYESQVALLEAVAEQAVEIRDHLLRFAAQDAEAFEAVVEAYRLPKETPEEEKLRAAAVQEALKGATEIPLRVMEECLQVIGLAKNVIESGLRSAASDGAVGAVLSRAGMQAASLNVKANLAGIDDEAYAQLKRTQMDEMLYMGTKVCTALDSYVNDLWTT